VKNRAHESEAASPPSLSTRSCLTYGTPEGNSISGPFTPEELAVTLGHLKPGKSPGMDSIFL